MRIKLSKSDWKNIGQKMGWLKTAEPDRRVIGYWYNGKRHTPEEALADLENGVLKATIPNAVEDDNGIPEKGVEDRNGELIDVVLEKRHFDSDDEDGYYADREINRERDTYGDHGQGY